MLRNYTMNFRPAAPGGARRAAPGAGARRRGDPARGPAYRPAASGDREARRVQDLYPVAALHGPPRLRVDDVQRARLLPGDREAPRHRRSDPRAIHPRDVRRDHSHPQPPAVARRAFARRRRDDHVPVLLPRARRPHGRLRGGVRRATARGLLPSRAASTAICRSGCRNTRCPRSTTRKRSRG